MSYGQSFQERSASFEHMYSPKKAANLFKRHREIEEKHSRDSARMQWEHKTMLNDLAKSKIIIERRGQVLYKKQRDIEEKIFRQIESAHKQTEQGEEEEEESHEYEDDVFPLSEDRPATHMGIRANKKLRNALVATLKNRPKTSYTADVTVSEIPTPDRKRPSSSSNAKNTTSIVRQNSSVVQFTVDDNKEEEDNSENKRLASSPTSSSAPYFARKSSVLVRRSRRKSVFALTKAKQIELRNKGFKEENEMFQEELQDKIDDFFQNLDRYKATYKRSLEPRSSDLPEITDKDVTNTEDISGHNNMSDKFKVKTINPFKNNIRTKMAFVGKEPINETNHNDDISTVNERNDKQTLLLKSPSEYIRKTHSRESLNSIHSGHSTFSGKCNPVYVKTGNGLSDLNNNKSHVVKHENKKTVSDASNNAYRSLISRSSMVSRSSQLSCHSAVFTNDNHSSGLRPVTASTEAVKRTLSIARRQDLKDDNKSSKELRKERIKLLYLDAHGQLDDFEEKTQTVKKKPPLKSRYTLNTELIRDAFDEYVKTNQTTDDMMKLVSLTMKLKHEERKKRDRSFVPFIAVRKLAMQWKCHAKKHQQELQEEKLDRKVEESTNAAPILPVQ